ncbi:MAG: hypothetical protein V4650_08900 [Pseudomonadota bacterium]
MDAIWNYLGNNPILLIVLLLVIAYLFSRLRASVRPEGVVDPEDLVPHYKRFERREDELGDRRGGKAPAPAEEQRKAGRRAAD